MNTQTENPTAPAPIAGQSKVEIETHAMRIAYTLILETLDAQIEAAVFRAEEFEALAGKCGTLNDHGAFCIKAAAEYKAADTLAGFRPTLLFRIGQVK